MELFEGVNAASGVTGGFVATPDHPNQPKWYDDVDAVMASFPAGEAIWFRPDTVYTSAIDGRKVKIKEGKQWVYLEASDECAQVEPMELRPAGVLPTAEPALIEVPGVLDASKLPITAFMSEEALSAEVEWEQFGNEIKQEAAYYGEVGKMMETTVNIYVEGCTFIMTAGAGTCAIGSLKYADDALKYSDDILKYADDALNLADDAAKTGGRVFWSGGDIAKNEAADFAKANGMKTLEMTTSGRIMNSVSSYLPRSVSRPIWDKLSSNFAKGAFGEINVFQNAAGVGMKSTWRMVEYPILKNQNIIYHIVK